MPSSLSGSIPGHAIPPAPPITARKANLPILFHGENAPALPDNRKGQSGRLLRRPQRDYPAATVADFSTADLTERHLRPSVIFRKVTNGFRHAWGAETYAAFRSVVSTAKVNGASALETVRFVLTTKLSAEPLQRVG